MKSEPDAPSSYPTARPSGGSDAGRSGGRAVIGPSITVQGEISGSEDLLVLGRVEGKIDLGANQVTIGSGGQVKADVYGKTITVEGEVEGNLFGSEQVAVKSAGRVHGNLTAPRVALEDGAQFKGAIDMEPSPRGGQGGTATREARTRANAADAAGDTSRTAGGGNPKSTAGNSRTAATATAGG